MPTEAALAAVTGESVVGVADTAAAAAIGGGVVEVAGPDEDVPAVQCSAASKG